MTGRLRDFQRDIKKRLMEGHSAILLAPTGLCKTRAAILPFIENFQNKVTTRVIYSLPIRALAKGVQEEFENFNVRAVIH
ncbi:MAG: DEAD/DEAH box helicase family protein, partial [Candidatus Syntropharchaeia archaeon]